jgi:hypothetical protein
VWWEREVRAQRRRSERKTRREEDKKTRRRVKFAVGATKERMYEREGWCELTEREKSGRAHAPPSTVQVRRL